METDAKGLESNHKPAFLAEISKCVVIVRVHIHMSDEKCDPLRYYCEDSSLLDPNRETKGRINVRSDLW